jgi:tetratricopeptide (TPR) repeat protein
VKRRFAAATGGASLAAGLAVVALIWGQTGCQKLKARDSLGQGVRAYKAAKYPEAVEHFRTAVELDPTFPTARLYLATAYMSQYIPGAESEENLRMAKAAYDEFSKVLETEPNNTVALASIASLHFHQKKFDDAESWYKKLVEADPKNKEGYYTLGVIAWTRTFRTRMEARAKLGMTPEAPGPLKDRKVREEIRAVNMPIIEAGLQDLEKALSVDPEYDDAMAYMNLLTRERADLQDTPEAYRKDTEIADGWVQKTLETKKIKASRQPATGGISTEY